MSMDVFPEASGSTGPLNPLHLSTLVFDANLTREEYVKLVEADGVAHKIVQRLMERHGGDAKVGRLVLQIPPVK